MSAVQVVPALDPLEHGQVRLALCLEAGAIEQLALERCEEALGHRVVVRVADAAHRRTYAELLAALPERDRRVLAALVAVMDYVRRLALRDRHLERLQLELGPQMHFHRPAHDLAAEEVEHERQIPK